MRQVNSSNEGGQEPPPQPTPPGFSIRLGGFSARMPGWVATVVVPVTVGLVLWWITPDQVISILEAWPQVTIG